jgi:hypothetical protein
MLYASFRSFIKKKRLNRRDVLKRESGRKIDDVFRTSCRFSGNSERRRVDEVRIVPSTAIVVSDIFE